jgi:EmrB/QacA subfamily drug resistance transporter
MSNSVANVALPAVLDEFDIPIGAGVWFVTAFVLTLSVLLPAAGRLVDLFGTRRLYLWSLAGFFVSTAAVAAAPSYPALVAARGAQGITSAAVLPVLMVTIGAVFPTGARGKAVGAWATVNGVALALAPLLGGVVTDVFGWRMFFWGTLALIALKAPLALRYLPDIKPAGRGRFDGVGAGFLAGGLAGVLVGLSRAPDWGWGSPQVVVLLLTGTVLLAVFWRRCVRHDDAFIDLALFDDRRYTILSALAGLQMATVYGVMLLTPLVLINLFGYSIAVAGAMVFLLPLVLAVSSPAAGHLTDRHGVRRILRFGTAALVLAAGLMVPGVLTESLPLVLAALVLFGTGAGAIQSPSATGITETVDPVSAGLAQGTFHTIRFLSGVVGATTFATVLGATGSFAMTFLLAGGLGVAGVLSARALAPAPSHRATPDGVLR